MAVIVSGKALAESSKRRLRHLKGSMAMLRVWR